MYIQTLVIFISLMVALLCCSSISGAVAPLDPPPSYDLSRLPLAATQHPSLFLTPATLAGLRKSILTTHADLWATVRAQADGVVKFGPPPYQSTGDWEQLWQRPVGNALPTLAMAYLLTSDPTYLNSAKVWAKASCTYPTWGLGDGNGLDLAAGHQMLGLAILYDWCNADLDEPTRELIRQTLSRRGSAMYKGVLAGKTFWGRTYLQNHLWVNSVGLTAAALTLAPEPEYRADAAQWLGFTSYSFRRTLESLGDDGASHEGVAYWEYGIEYLLKYMVLSRDLLGADYFRTPWMVHTCSYFGYLSLPRNAWNRSDCIVDIGDSPRSHWYGPDYLLRKLASEYQDPHAQWYAEQVDQARVSNNVSSWLNLLWYDPRLKSNSPADLPTLHHFTDIDIVSSRSDWTGDESLVVFKCGPFIGHKAISAFSYDPGGSHVHPDAAHFVIFADGQWLLRDDGYRPKMTGSHNTLLIDSKGQLGEGKHWFDAGSALAVKSEPRITQASSTPMLDRISGDATTAYPANSGLQRYERHLLYLKPDVLIVIDDIAVNRAADLELRFHPETSSASRENDAMLMTTGKVNFRADLLTPEGATYKADMVPTLDRSSTKPSDFFTLHVQSHRDTWQTATAFSWATNKPAPIVILKKTSTKWTFSTGDRSVEFDWSRAKPVRVNEHT